MLYTDMTNTRHVDVDEKRGAIVTGLFYDFLLVRLSVILSLYYENMNVRD